MFFTTPGVAEFISGVILQDETIRQRSSTGYAAGRPARRAGNHPRHQGRHRRETARRLPQRAHHRRTRRAARSPRGVPRDRRALRQVAGGDRRRRYAAERDVRAGERARARAICRHLPGAGHRADRRARSADGRIAHDRALRRRDRERPPCRLRRALRAEGVSRRDAAQAQHGHLGQTVRDAGLRQRGRARHGALSPASCAGRRPRHRVPVRRPGSPRGDDAPERDQSGRRTEAVEAHATPTGARCRTKRSKPGADGRRTSQPHSRPSIIGRSATARLPSAGTRPPWKPNRSSREVGARPAAGRRSTTRAQWENYRAKAAIERTGRHHR